MLLHVLHVLRTWCRKAPWRLTAGSSCSCRRQVLVAAWNCTSRGRKAGQNFTRVRCWSHSFVLALPSPVGAGGGDGVDQGVDQSSDYSTICAPVGCCLENRLVQQQKSGGLDARFLNSIVM